MWVAAVTSGSVTGILSNVVPVVVQALGGSAMTAPTLMIEEEPSLTDAAPILEEPVLEEDVPILEAEEEELLKEAPLEPEDPRPSLPLFSEWTWQLIQRLRRKR